MDNARNFDDPCRGRQRGRVMSHPDDELLVVRCWHCEQSITRDDPADAWRLYVPLTPSTAYACPPSPDGEHEPTVCRACGGVEYGPCWACPPSLPGRPSGLDGELRRFLP